MEWGYPALTFLAITLAVGGACLGFLKKRFHNSHHHLLFIILVGAVAYLALLHIQNSSRLAVERLTTSWMGVARSIAHSLESAPVKGVELKREQMLPLVQRLKARMGKELGDTRAVSVATLQYEKVVLQTVGIQRQEDTPGIPPPCEAKVRKALHGSDQWCVETGKSGDAHCILAMLPLRDDADNVHAAMVLEFFPHAWNNIRLKEQWRGVGEFSGMLVILIALGGYLVMRAENRREKELENAVQPLMKDIESLDGMVNSVQGVVWERPAAGGTFTYLSQHADGYLGYSMDRWGNEPDFLENVTHSEDRQRVKNCWSQAAENLEQYQIEYRVVRANGTTAFVSECGQAAKLGLGGKVLRGKLLDITSQRENEASTQDMHKMMVEASRQAGMAEIATGVLHNVGNVLNSLNVGAKLLAERLKKSRMEKLCQAAQLLQQNLPDNPDFFVNDKRGQVLPAYLVDLSAYLRDEQNRLNATVSDMIERIEHIRDMIMLQQSHSSVRTLWEPLDLATVMEEALRLEMDVHMAHQQIKVVRHYADLPPVYAARGLLLQIIVNLLANACQAMGDKSPADRKLTLRIQPQGDAQVRLTVEDTGCGIHPRHLTSIFTQGFTTKKEGHGFGLHHASLLAQDLGGTLRAESDGLGKGARFILEIPARKDSKGGPHSLPSSVSA